MGGGGRVTGKTLDMDYKDRNIADESGDLVSTDSQPLEVNNEYSHSPTAIKDHENGKEIKKQIMVHVCDEYGIGFQ